jgi:hypothetical protein
MPLGTDNGSQEFLFRNRERGEESGDAVGGRGRAAILMREVFLTVRSLSARDAEVSGEDPVKGDTVVVRKAQPDAELLTS